MTGYSSATKEEELHELFSQVGSLKEVLMKRGFSFIEYRNPEHAAAAIKQFDGQTFRDRKLRVEKTSKSADC